MKKLGFFYAAAISMTMGLGFVACGDDEPADGTSAIVTPTVSNTLGWSSADGVDTYTIENDANLADGDFNYYFSLSSKSNKVKEAVFTMVTLNSNVANRLAAMLNDGSWVALDEEEAMAVKSHKAAASHRKFDVNLGKILRKMLATRASGLTSLPLPVNVQGACIYVTIPGLEGKATSLAKNVINYWCDYDSEIQPSEFVFGTWDGSTYICNNMAGIGVTYKVVTSYDADGYCDSYVTSITCPNASWAALLEAEMNELAGDFKDFFGAAPTINRNGNTVSVNAVIVDKMEKEYIVALLQSFDWINNAPFLYQIAD